MPTGNMQICRLCAEEQKTRRGKYNKSEEWVSLVKTICGYLGHKEGVDWETTWLCGSCHKQAKTTQSFMRLVEAGQRKLKRLLTLKEDAPEEQTPLVEAMENGETDIELGESVKLDTEAETSATTDCSDDEAENRNAEFLDKVKLSKRARCKPKHQNKVQNLVPRRNGLKLEVLVPKHIAELRSSEGFVLATILESRFANKNRSSQSFLMCKLCSSIFRKDSQFWQHFETHHNEMLKNQNIANTKNGSAHRSKGAAKLRKASAAAQESMKCRIDKNSSRIFCLQCPKSFIACCGVARHYRQIHNPNKPKRVFKCEQCDVTFKRNCVLQRHYAKHTGIKPFACDTCGKSFIEKHELNRHMIVHTGEKPYKCQFCDKAFAFRTTTIIHERLHTGQRPYQCSICEMRFSNPSNFKAHKNLHLKKALKDLELKSAEKKSVADSEEIEPEVNSSNHTILLSQCKTYRGAARSLLKPRTVTASAPKTLRNSTSAAECGPAVSTRTERVATSSLITLPESQQQPALSKFQCMHCLKNCKTSSTLIKHLRTHTDDKPYQCQLCPKSFADPSKFKRHRIQHKNAADVSRKATTQISYDSSYFDESNWSVYVDDASSRQSYPALLARISGAAEDPLA